MNIAVTAASDQLERAIVKTFIDIVGSENIIAIARTPQNTANLGADKLTRNE